MALPTQAQINALPLDKRIKYDERAALLVPEDHPDRKQQEALLLNFALQFGAPPPKKKEAPIEPAPSVIPQVRSPAPEPGGAQWSADFSRAQSQLASEILNLEDQKTGRDRKSLPYNEQQLLLRQAEAQANLVLEEQMGRGAATQGWNPGALVKTADDTISPTLLGKAGDVVKAFGRQPIETPEFVDLRKARAQKSGVLLQRQIKDAVIAEHMVPELMSGVAWVDGIARSEEVARERAQALLNDPSQDQGLSWGVGANLVLDAEQQIRKQEEEYIEEMMKEHYRSALLEGTRAYYAALPKAQGRTLGETMPPEEVFAEIDAWAQETAKNLTQRWQYENIPQSLLSGEEREALEAARAETEEARRAREQTKRRAEALGFGGAWDDEPLTGESEAGELLESRTAATLRGVVGTIVPLLEGFHQAFTYETDEEGEPLDPKDFGIFESTRKQQSRPGAMPPVPPDSNFIERYLVNTAQAVKQGKGVGAYWREVPAFTNTASNVYGWLSGPPVEADSSHAMMPIWGGGYSEYKAPTEEEKKKAGENIVYGMGTVAEMFIPFTWPTKLASAAARLGAPLAAGALRGAAKATTKGASWAAENLARAPGSETMFSAFGPEGVPFFWRAEKAAVKGAKVAEDIADAMPQIAVHLARPLRSAAQLGRGLTQASVAKEMGAVVKGLDWARGPTYLASLTVRSLVDQMVKSGARIQDIVDPKIGPALWEKVLRDQKRATKSGDVQVVFDRMLLALGDTKKSKDWSKSIGELEEEFIDIVATELFSSVPDDLIFVTGDLAMSEDAFLKTKDVAGRMLGESRKASSKGWSAGDKVSYTVSLDNNALIRNGIEWEAHPDPNARQIIKEILESPDQTKAVSQADFAVVENALATLAYKSAAKRAGVEPPRVNLKLSEEGMAMADEPLARRLSLVRDAGAIIRGLFDTFPSLKFRNKGKAFYDVNKPEWIDGGSVEDYSYIPKTNVVIRETRNLIKEAHGKIASVPDEWSQMLQSNQRLLKDPTEAYLKSLNEVLDKPAPEDVSWNDLFFTYFAQYFFKLDSGDDKEILDFLQKKLSSKTRELVTRDDIVGLLNEIRDQTAGELSPRKAGLRKKGVMGYVSAGLDRASNIFGGAEDIMAATDAAIMSVMTRQKFDEFGEDLLKRHSDILIKMPQDSASKPFSFPPAQAAFVESSDTEQIAYQTMRYVIQEFLKRENYTGRKLYSELMDSMFDTGFVTFGTSASNLASASWANGLREAVREALLDMDPDLFYKRKSVPDVPETVVAREAAPQMELFGSPEVQGALDGIVDGLWNKREEGLRLRSTEGGPLAPRSIRRYVGVDEAGAPIYERQTFPEEISKKDFSKAFVDNYKRMAQEGEVPTGEFITASKPTPKLKKLIDEAWEREKPPSWTQVEKARAQELIAQGASKREVSKKGRVVGEEKKVLREQYKEQYKPDGKKLSKKDFQSTFVEDFRQQQLSEGGDLNRYFTKGKPTPALRQAVDNAWREEQARFINEEVTPFIIDYAKDLDAFRKKLGDAGLTPGELKMVFQSFADGDPVRFGASAGATQLQRATNKMLREARIPRRAGLVPEERALAEFKNALDDLLLKVPEGTKRRSHLFAPRGQEQLVDLRAMYAQGTVTPEDVVWWVENILDVGDLEKPPAEWARFTEAFEGLQDFQRQAPGVRRFDPEEFRALLNDPDKFSQMYEAMLEAQTYDMMGTTMQDIANRMAKVGVPLADTLNPNAAIKMPVGWKQALLKINDNVFIYADETSKELWKEFTQGVVEGKFKTLLEGQQKRGASLMLSAIAGTLDSSKRAIISGLLGGIGPIPTTRFIGTNHFTFPLIQQVTAPGMQVSTLRHWVDKGGGSRQILREFKGSSLYQKYVQAKQDEVILTARGRKYTAGEIHQLMEEHNALTSQVAFEFGENELRDLYRISRMNPDFTSYMTKGNPWGITAKKLLREASVAWDPRFATQFARLNKATDNGYREAMFIAGLENGLPPSQAATLSRNVLFDYDSISQSERKVMARYIMFYSFARLAFTETMKALVRNPEGALNNIARLTRFQQNQKREAGTLSFEPDYAVSRLYAFELSRTPEGVPIYALGPDIPQLKVVSQIAPALMAALEVATGRTQIKDEQYILRNFLTSFITDPRAEDIFEFMSESPESSFKDGQTIDPKLVAALKAMPGGLGDWVLFNWLKAEILTGDSRVAGKPTFTAPSGEQVQYKYGAGSKGNRILMEEILLHVGLQRVLREHTEGLITAGILNEDDDIGMMKQLEEGNALLKSLGLQSTVTANTYEQMIQRLRRLKTDRLKEIAEK